MPSPKAVSDSAPAPGRVKRRPREVSILPRPTGASPQENRLGKDGHGRKSKSIDGDKTKRVSDESTEVVGEAAAALPATKGSSQCTAPALKNASDDGQGKGSLGSSPKRPSRHGIAGKGTVHWSDQRNVSRTAPSPNVAVASWPPTSSASPLAAQVSSMSSSSEKKFHNLPTYDRVDEPPADPNFDLNRHDPTWVGIFEEFVMLRRRAATKGILSEEWLDDLRHFATRNWVNSQRSMYWYRAHVISAYGPNSAKVQGLLAKIAKLRALDFVWFPEQQPPDSATDEWKDYFLDLRNFIRTRGHSSVPNTSELGLWAALQRKKFKNHTLHRDRVEALSRVGFVWDDKQSDWFLMLSKLKEFRDIYDDCLVPCPETVEPIPGESLDEFKGYEDLWWWMQKVRIERNKEDSHLDDGQIEELKELKFIWKRNISQNWIWHFRMLKQVMIDKGSMKDFSDADPTLRNWVNHQREYYRKMQRNEKGLRRVRSNLSEETIELLNSIEFDWAPSPPLGFDKRFELLVEFKNKHGHLFVPQTDKINGNFVKMVRKAYSNYQNGKKADITEERIARLTEIGFIWRVRNKRGLGRQTNTPLDSTQAAYREARKRRKAMEAAAEPIDNSNGTEDDTRN